MSRESTQYHTELSEIVYYTVCKIADRLIIEPNVQYTVRCCYCVFLNVGLGIPWFVMAAIIQAKVGLRFIQEIQASATSWLCQERY